MWSTESPDTIRVESRLVSIGMGKGKLVWVYESGMEQEADWVLWTWVLWQSRSMYEDARGDDGLREPNREAAGGKRRCVGVCSAELGETRHWPRL